MQSLVVGFEPQVAVSGLLELSGLLHFGKVHLALHFLEFVQKPHIVSLQITVFLGQILNLPLLLIVFILQLRLPFLKRLYSFQIILLFELFLLVGITELVLHSR